MEMSPSHWNPPALPLRDFSWRGLNKHLLTLNRAPQQAKNSIPLSGTVRILELLMIPRVTQRQVFGENPTLSWVKAQGS